jgi:Skp family chaperone for outer membrane proteins
MFDIADDQTEMSVRLAEIIKAKSQEYHQCESRIENLTKKLQGDRAERMKKNSRENASFLSIVQLFQEEEERKIMVRIAEMQKETIKEEAERLEGMVEWKARVLGISQEDVI